MLLLEIPHEAAVDVAAKARHPDPRTDIRIEGPIVARQMIFVFLVKQVFNAYSNLKIW